MSQQASEENKKLSNYITNIVGINKIIDRHYDKEKKNFIDIFTCDDPLYPRIKICGTIGVSDHPNKIEMNNNSFKDIPIELLIGGYREFKMLSNILSTAGFYITNNGWECQPGSVFMRIVEMYFETSEMKHIMFTSPFLWEEKLQPLKLETKTVHWLLCIPISDKELEYKMENGTSALEDIFQEKDIDIFDINRKSAI
ncbi:MULTISPECIES: suppressor of fused domain protein [unclassified Chryseobacterium]|uniref:suppressor of fused domain protein n=1 Tax=unclassified Chryseobacterium TaxID=2593645 RepID=UPI0028532452|nr:suppressor of fused domain protein [Chryseobacterium sp. CFS7]MDR4892724.1 suppressor of fused domain protein [Chryseobacterium sp. CFS7]